MLAPTAQGNPSPFPGYTTATPTTTLVTITTPTTTGPITTTTMTTTTIPSPSYYVPTAETLPPGPSTDFVRLQHALNSAQDSNCDTEDYQTDNTSSAMDDSTEKETRESTSASTDELVQIEDANGFKRVKRRKRGKKIKKQGTDKLVPPGGTGPKPSVPVIVEPHTKGDRVPPIVLRDKTKWNALRTEIARRGIQTVKSINNNHGIRILPRTKNDYRLLVDAVTQLKYEFHSYQLTEDKPLKVVLRGIPETIKPEEIQQDLHDQGFNILQCSRMTVGDTANRRDTPLIFISLPRTEASAEIYKIQHVCGLCITVENKTVKKEFATQCHRCQLYGHGQRLCRAEPRCVKCAEKHPSAECTKARNIPAVCALCGGPHPANYKACPEAPHNKDKTAHDTTENAATSMANTAAQTNNASPTTQNTTPTESGAAHKKNKRRNVPTETTTTHQATVETTSAMDTTEPTASTSTDQMTYAKAAAAKTAKKNKKQPTQKQSTTQPDRATANDNFNYAEIRNMLSQLTPLISKINWKRLFEIAVDTIPALFKCKSLTEAGMVLLGRFEDIISIFTHNG